LKAESVMSLEIIWVYSVKQLTWNISQC